MRYALRKKDKIASAYSDEYLKEHIIKSLNEYFFTFSNQMIEYEIKHSDILDNTNYPILRINDSADDNCMLEFAVLNKIFDVLKLSFLGRMKG